MIPTVRRLELAAWGVTPALIAVLLALFCLTPKHLPGLSSFMPNLPLIPVYYWGLTHARAMPVWFVFLLGLAMDAGSGQPLGADALLYLFFLGVLRAQRGKIHKEGFIIKWGMFAVLLATMASLHWLLLSLYDGQFQAGGAPFLQWLLSVACYPLFHHAFDKLQAFIAARKWKLLHGH